MTAFVFKGFVVAAATTAGVVVGGDSCKPPPLVSKRLTLFGCLLILLRDALSLTFLELCWGCTACVNKVVKVVGVVN